MIRNRGLRMCLMVLVTAGMTAMIGCGDDEPSGTDNNATNNANNTNNDTNNQADVGTDPDTGGNTPDANNDTPDTGGGDPPPPPPPKCGDTPAPERCTAERDGFEYGMASVATKFDLSFELDAAHDPVCCFDLNKDGINNNALGELLDSLAALIDPEGINESINDSIASGSMLLMFEHDGLENLTGGEFTINFFLGKYTEGMTELDPAGSNELLIDPASIEQGLHPHAVLPQAKLEAGKVTAGPGAIVIQIELLGATLGLTVSAAMISADVDGARTSEEGGVALNNGKIGGAARVNDIYDSLNTFIATCDCLNNPAAAIDYSDGYSCTLPDNTCEDGDVCKSLAQYCGMLGLLQDVADIDTTGDDEPDAVSLGATFTAAGAKIMGVAE